MVRFGYDYVNGKLVIYDVTVETRAGRVLFVAALSEAPHIHFAATRQEVAVRQLLQYLHQQSRNLAWMPTF